MIRFVLLSLPVFGVVALGWAAMRARLASAGTLEALGAFAFRFALPALVVRLIAGQPFGSSYHPVFYAGYLACGGLVFALVFALKRLRGGPAAAAGARAATATVGNLGFLGPPLMLSFFGERGAGPLAMAILAEVAVLMSLGAMIMGARTGVGGSAPLLRGTLLNPVVAAVAAGGTLAASGVALPDPVDRLLGFLGGAAGPAALFALGGALAAQRLDRATALAASGVAAAKLLVCPVLVWCVLGGLLRLESLWVQAGVLLAALPSAGSTHVLAQRYGADAERVSAAIVLSTTLSAISVPLVAWLVMR